MTPIQSRLQQTIALSEKATPGPWEAEPDCDLVEWQLGSNLAQTSGVLCGPKRHRTARSLLFDDCEFIAHARTAAPAYARALMIALGRLTCSFRIGSERCEKCSDCKAMAEISSILGAE